MNLRAHFTTRETCVLLFVIARLNKQVPIIFVCCYGLRSVLSRAYERMTGSRRALYCNVTVMLNPPHL